MGGEARLGEVAEIIMGQSPPGETYNEHGQGLPFFQGVTDFNYRYPTPRVFCSAPSRIAVPGDILLSVRAPIGRVNVADRKCAIGRGLSIIRPRTPEDARYLEFALRMKEPNWDAIEGSGSVFGNATRRDLEELCLPWPEGANDRCAIAHILGTLDDKIELNRRMNRTLEEMARAIFKSWFVDFDPVRAKAAVRREHPNWTNAQVSRAACPNLKPEIAELFPDRLVNSELGEIPMGWSVRPLPEIMHINPTRSLPKGTLAPYLDMANMPTQGPSPDTCVMREMGSGMKFTNGDTLVARITPCLENGKTAFVDFLADGEVGWGSTEYIVLRPKGTIPPLFAYLLARTDEFRMFAIQQMTGSSGRQRVPAASLEKYRIVTPDIDSPPYLNFGNIVSPMFDRIRASMLQSRTLAALRDALLPKLISGEIWVKDAEKIALQSEKED